MTAERIYRHAVILRCRATPKGEATIAKNAAVACLYADEVLRGPFPEGEAAIATKPNAAYHYATEVLDGPFPAGEAAIAKDAQLAYLYARYRLKGPFPAAEATIAGTKYEQSYLDFLLRPPEI